MDERIFRYHAPTPETQPKFEAIRAKEKAVDVSIVQGLYENLNTVSMYNLINSECMEFAVLIENLCPDSDQRKRAIDAVALARNYYNEGITLRPTMTHLWEKCWALACDQLQIARFLANASIALNSPQPA